MLLSACTLAAFAADTPPRSLAHPYTEIGFSHARENLSTHPKPWTDTQIDVVHRFAPRKLFLGRATSSERFGLHDDMLAVGGYHPLGERTTAFAELAGSDTHRVLPRRSAQFQVGHSVAQGWGVLAGLKHVAYTSTAVDIAELTLERYFGDYRAAIGAYPSRSRTSGNAASYRAQLSRYYGEENNIQVLYARGIEVDTPTAAGSVLATSVSSIALFGRHWMSREWALTYSIAHTVQADTIRRGGSLGLRYRF